MKFVIIMIMSRSNFEDDYRKLVKKKNVFNEKILIKLIKITKEKLKYDITNDD